MYCPKCGMENPDDAQQCRSCGTPVDKGSGGIVPITSGLAIAAFVLAVLSFVFFPVGLVAIILGIAGLIIIEKSGGRLTGRVFAVLAILIPVFVFCLIFVLMMLLYPAMSRAREQGKRAVCLSNLKQLTLAWIMYADDNDNRIINGAAGQGRAGEPPWTGRDWASDYGILLQEQEQKDALMGGALWPYCHAAQLYRCPAGRPGHMRTYSIVESMNGIGGQGTDEVQGVYIKKRMEIREPGGRLVFMDVGEVMPETYSVYYDQQKWWDQPPVRHGDGTNVSFADGHAEYWEWRGAETIERGRAAIIIHNPDPAGHWSPRTSEGIEDLKKTQEGCWGRLGRQR